MQREAVLNNPMARAAECAGELPMHAEAFTAFYERSARPLWAYLLRAGGDAALADDLTQEAFVRFLTVEATHDGEIAARRYLFRIATNLLRDHWRKPRHESTDAEGAAEPAAHGFQQGSDSATELAVVFQQISPRDRQLLWLAYAEGYSHREIAEITRLTLASVKLLLFRARRRAAQTLGNDQAEAILATEGGRHDSQPEF